MSVIHSYLTFNGNCREAMKFYQDCLGGELSFQTIGESPMAEDMPPPLKESIVHATLTRGPLVLLASDMVSDKGLIKGNAVSLLLQCHSEEEAKEYYTKLSAGGQATHPMEKGFWGAVFGDLTDKYGNQWLLHCTQQKNIPHEKD